tara:strand:+ start:61 stop:375 length:315 start_codon:yes stop_codon:yes gene_type:complete
MENKPKPNEFFHANFFNEYKVNLDLYNMQLAKRSPTYNHQNRILNIEVVEYVDNTRGKDFLNDNHWNLFINYQMEDEVIVAEEIPISQLEKLYDFLKLVLSKKE